jgi:hypothetical protein
VTTKQGFVVPAGGGKRFNMGARPLRRRQAKFELVVNVKTAKTLFDALQAFFQEHQYCGDVDTGVEGDYVWMTCTCGAVVSQALEPARPFDSPRRRL